MIGKSVDFIPLGKFEKGEDPNHLLAVIALGNPWLINRTAISEILDEMLKYMSLIFWET